MSVKIKPETQSQLVYDKIREKIRFNCYAPGMRLIEEEIAGEMGVSRSSVRAAFHKLTSEGVLKYIPHKGVIIPILDKQEVVSIMEVREAIEAKIVKLATERATEEDINCLEEILKRMQQAVNSNSLLDYAELNIKFHERICDASKNIKAKEILQNYSLQLVRLRFSGLMRGGRVLQALSEHEAILKAIKNRNVDEAADMVISHINKVLKAWEETGII